jgi:eukaryotic-like serine/threonine-protein kinase
MSLTAGTKLGPYEILAPLGAGGMGEVYRAKDTKLDREVAIKILPDAVAQDPERLARFEREAKVLASLNHPNIAQIYGVEEHALVMELVAGENLSGPLPVETALDYARQIADALEAAHEKGITHRDLKPANIMITPTGVVKVLDFGLAAVSPDPASGSADPPNSPTLTMRATQAGMLMGTAAYMSPEQAAGKAVDKRADIWSFGVVLWEMLTGERLFGGETISHTLADVLRAPFDFEKLPKETPAHIRELLRRCLDRDVKTRLRDIGEARVAIGKVGQISDLPAKVEGRSHSKLLWIWAAIATVALAALAFLYFRHTPPQDRVLRYTVAAPEGSTVHGFAVSPDGRSVAIAATVNGKRQLWLRVLDALQIQPLLGTEDATYPFWSPDSRYIGFFAQGKLRKIAAGGGPAQSLCDARDGRGGTWNRDDVIVFSPSGGEAVIQRVAAAGGVSSGVTQIKGDLRFPVFLPDGRHFLYLVTRISPEKNGVYLSSLDGQENRRILADVSSAVFAPTAPGSRGGHLLFLRENTLMAQPFDAVSGQTSGDVFPVVEGVTFGSVGGTALVTVSENGVLLYASVGAVSSRQIVWYDRAGKLLSSVGAPGGVWEPAISPDEKTIAFRRSATNGGADIWLRDLAHATEIRFTSDGSFNTMPVWSPKSDLVIFRSSSGGHESLHQKLASGSGQEKLLLLNNFSVMPNQWSRDGRFIVHTVYDPKTKYDLGVLPVVPGAAGGQKPIPFLHSEFNELQGQLSPDSRWMAYTADDSGQREVYVRPFPAAEGIWRISTAGGEQPRWRGDGKELFFVGADGKMMAVAVKASAGARLSFETGAPLSLFDPHIALAAGTLAFLYDVTADGKRFLAVNTNNVAASTPPLNVVVNWNAGLKK